MLRLRLSSLVFGIGLALLVAAPVSAQAVQQLRIGQKADLGRFITDAQGKTLYLYTRDNGTTSTCEGNCLVTWPPLVQAAGSPTLGPGLGGTVGVATQADGRRQVTYNGKLLYYYRSDNAAGDTAGQNVGGVWFVVEAVAGAAALPVTGGGPVGALGHAGWIVGGAGALVLGAGAALRRRRI